MTNAANELAPLWQLVDDLAKRRKEPFERIWLKVMRAFWRGEFASGGLWVRQSIPGTRGIQTDGPLNRHELAGVAMGEREYAKRGPDDAIKFLLDWSRDDYRSREDFRGQYIFSDWFLGRVEDCGLCVERCEWESWARGAGLVETENNTLEGLKADMRDGKALKFEVRARAAALGIEPWNIEWEPDLACFDPTNAASWTMAMAVAWIVWRTPQAVRRSWPEYRAECWYVVWGDDKRHDDGYGLEQFKPQTLALLMMDDDSMSAGPVQSEPSCCTVKEAWKDLFNELEKGTLAATGKKGEWGSRQRIESIEWRGLVPVFDSHPADAVGRSNSETDGRYRDVTLLSADVVRIWQPVEPEGAAVPASAPFEAVCPNRAAKPTKLQTAIDSARRLWPDGLNGPHVQRKEQQKLIRDDIARLGGSAPSDRTIDRALSEFKKAKYPNQ